MTRHKHADLIIAWANDTSLEIEQFILGTSDEWVRSESPTWHPVHEYRIKPKKGDFICEIDGVKWYLGPEAPDHMTWTDAKSWCEEQGCELPPREVLLMCYLNESIRKQFKEDYFWSSTEYTLNLTALAWLQIFLNGAQNFNDKDCMYYVRGVFREEVK